MSAFDEHKHDLELDLSTIIIDLESIATLNTETGDWVAIPVGAEHAEADPNVSADTVESWNERRATVAQLETRYHNLKLALKKFETNTYGICEICGEAIETDRLGANPAARTCKIHMERERELAI